MSPNYLSLVKIAEAQEESMEDRRSSFNNGFGIGGSILPALAGTLGGGAIGYLTGRDANEAEGEKSTRLRNAIIGALLGNVTTGAGYYGLTRMLGNKAGMFDAFQKGLEKEQESQAAGSAEPKADQVQSAAPVVKQGSISDTFSGAMAGLGTSALKGVVEPSVTIPALLGLLGGGVAGYTLTENKDNRFRNAILGALAGTTTGGLSGGVFDIVKNMYKSRNLSTDKNTDNPQPAAPQNTTQNTTVNQ